MLRFCTVHAHERSTPKPGAQPPFDVGSVTVRSCSEHVVMLCVATCHSSSSLGCTLETFTAHSASLYVTASQLQVPAHSSHCLRPCSETLDCTIAFPLQPRSICHCTPWCLRGVLPLTRRQRCILALRCSVQHRCGQALMRARVLIFCRCIFRRLPGLCRL